MTAAEIMQGLASLEKPVVSPHLGRLVRPWTADEEANVDAPSIHARSATIESSVAAMSCHDMPALVVTVNTMRESLHGQPGLILWVFGRN